MKCRACNRKLTSATSIERGYGPTCWAKEMAFYKRVISELADFSDRQLDKAEELLDDKGLQPTRRAGFWLAVASNGIDTYLVHRYGCNCPAGVKARRCYHRAAVLIQIGVDR